MLMQIIVWLNALANALGMALLWPIAHLPGWLSATLVAMVTGVLMLLVSWLGAWQLKRRGEPARWLVAGGAAAQPRRRRPSCA